jgi:hypothetical protein
LAAKKKKRRWPVLLGILLVILALAWLFRPYLERRFGPKKQSRPTVGKEKVQERISEEERKKLDEILKSR